MTNAQKPTSQILCIRHWNIGICLEQLEQLEIRSILKSYLVLHRNSFIAQ